MKFFPRREAPPLPPKPPNAGRAHAHARGTALRAPRLLALWVISGLVLASAVASFAESYRGLFEWAGHHGLLGFWQDVFPLQVDTFIGVGELALFVALVDGWRTRDRAAAWAVAGFGLVESVAGNVGHIASHALTSRATAAVPPLAAAAALAVGLGVLKRVVGNAPAPAAVPALATVPADTMSAARESLAATIAAGNPLSQNQLQDRFGLTRAQAGTIRAELLAPTNGHTPAEVTA